jgi:hypothetical protein
MADFGDAVMDFANRRYQRGLQDKVLERQQKLDSRQAVLDGRVDEQYQREKKRQTEDDEAGKAASDRYKEVRDQLAAEAAQQSRAPTSIEAPGLSSLNGPAPTLSASQPQGRGLSLAAQKPGQPPQGDQQPDAQPGLASLNNLSVGGDQQRGVQKLAAPEKTPEWVADGRATYEAGLARSAAYLKAGRFDDYIANRAKQAQLGSALLKMAAEKSDSQYQMTGDPTVYIKNMSHYNNDGIDFVGSEKKTIQGQDGKPVEVYSVTTRDRDTGKESTKEVTGAEILQNAAKLSDPELAKEIAKKEALERIAAAAKILEQNNKASNDRDTEKFKSGLNLNEISARGNEERRTKGTVSGDAIYKHKEDSGGLSQKEALASVREDRLSVANRRANLLKEYQIQLKDAENDPSYPELRAHLKAKLDAETTKLDAEDEVLKGKRSVLSERVGLSSKIPGAPATGAPQKISSRAQFNALPSGSQFVAPDGTLRRKP